VGSRSGAPHSRALAGSPRVGPTKILVRRASLGRLCLQPDETQHSAYFASAVSQAGSDVIYGRQP
jgi:hypothetical protein